MPKRIQLSRAKGWRLPPHAVKVDRTTRWGNPWVIGEKPDLKQMRRWGWQFSPAGRKFVCQCAEQAVAKFDHCLLFDEGIHDFIRNELEGRDLACWCPLEQPCHADVLLRIANSDRETIRAEQDAIDNKIMADAAAAVRAASH